MESPFHNRMVGLMRGKRKIKNDEVPQQHAVSSGISEEG